MIEGENINTHVLFFIIFIFLSLVMLLLSLILKIKDERKKKYCCQKIKGNVIEYALCNNNGVHFPIVEYTINGVKYTQRLKYSWVIVKSSSFKRQSCVENNIGDSNLVVNENFHIHQNVLKDKFPVGTQLYVYYNPMKPQESYVMRYAENPLKIVFLVVGILFLMMAFIGLL